MVQIGILGQNMPFLGQKWTISPKRLLEFVKTYLIKFLSDLPIHVVLEFSREYFGKLGTWLNFGS